MSKAVKFSDNPTLQYHYERQVREAGNRAIKRYEERSIFDLCTKKPANETEKAKKQREAADKAIRHYEVKGTEFNQLMRTFEGRDRIIKASVAGLAVVNELLQKSDADTYTKEGFLKFMHTAKDARTIFALMNVFNQVVGSTQETFEAIYDILSGLAQGDEVLHSGSFEISAEEGCYKLNDGSKRPISPDDLVVDPSGGETPRLVSSFGSHEALFRHFDNIDGKAYEIHIKREVRNYDSITRETSVFRGRDQLLVGLLSMVGQAGAGSTYILGFGLCSPVKCIDNHWKLGKSINSIGNEFARVMFYNHVFESAHAIGALIHQGMIYSKAADDDESAVRTFWTNFVKIIACFFEKACELGADLFTVFKQAGPPLIKLLCTFAASCISLWRAFNNLHVDGLNAIRRSAEEREKEKILALLNAQSA